MTELPVASPCISVCRMNPKTHVCEGCFRTIDEIANWMAYTNPERQAVLERCDARQFPSGGGVAA